MTEVEKPSEIVKCMFGNGFEKIELYANLLAEEGEKLGLIGPKESQRLWSRYIVNCGSLLQFMPQTGTIIDVGSGAGLPGIVIAGARPDLHVTLLEPMERRCTWLKFVVEQMGISNVAIISERAQVVTDRIKADVVTARAVSALPKLVLMTAKLIIPGGKLLALKGKRAYQEILDAAKELKTNKLIATVHEVASIMDGEITYVVECKSEEPVFS